jgi:hypothetical protein
VAVVSAETIAVSVKLNSIHVYFNRPKQIPYVAVCEKQSKAVS